MGDVVVVEHVSLDGVMQSPGRPDEDTQGGFDRGGWATQLLSADPAAAAAAMEGQGTTAALPFERTYAALDVVRSVTTETGIVVATYAVRRP